MMSFSPYDGDAYWDYQQIVNWCHSLVRAHSEWVALETIGVTAEGRPILLITLGKNSAISPTFWLDGGTHASEWTGVMATIYSLSKWVAELQTPQGQKWFSENAICVCPCISPDGFEALHQGAPFIRSSTRKPLDGVSRVGLDPQDIDGDGKVLLMRWRHPAGPFVLDESKPLGLRHRALLDDPKDAFFLCQEGAFIQWDGVKWIQAPPKHGLDLNRNFPVHWEPFQMFGMDAGAYSLSEPESRAVVDAVYKRSKIAVGLTNHTYTGCILTQPYRKNSVLGKADINLMYRLAEASVVDTDYRVLKVYPDFTYDPDKSIIGVWADCLSVTFGIPAYTLELWDPYKWAGVTVDKPASFFAKPDPVIIDKMLEKAASTNFHPWTVFEHPQLGPVEIGGIEYLKTIRNPPVELLQQECEQGFAVANSLRHSMPRLSFAVKQESLGEDLHRIQVVVENLGFLSTTSSQRAVDVGLASGVILKLEPAANQQIVEGIPEQNLGRLEGWGDLQVASAKHMIYPSLPTTGHRASAMWIVKGSGECTLRWDGGRAGAGKSIIST